MAATSSSKFGSRVGSQTMEGVHVHHVRLVAEQSPTPAAVTGDVAEDTGKLMHGAGHVQRLGTGLVDLLQAATERLWECE